MDETQALKKMIAPGQKRPGKYREGVIQVWVTRACDQCCFGCTQGSNLGRDPGLITPEQFEKALLSLKGYWGVVGMFGGNPAVHPQFKFLCELMRKHVPFEQRGLWSNNPITAENAKVMRETFNPSVSNLNVHLNQKAYDLFKQNWPESQPVGLTVDSRHSPVYIAIKDVVKKPCPVCEERDPFERNSLPTCILCGGEGRVVDEDKAWELISDCDINKHWSAMIGVFRGELRAWFCEIAGAQSMLHQHEPNYPDTGLDPTVEYEHETIPGERIEVTVGKWWELGMAHFADQVRKHCFECGVPLRGRGELAMAPQAEGKEQVSETHTRIFTSKRPGRRVELVTVAEQLGSRLERMIDYLGNSKR